MLLTQKALIEGGRALAYYTAQQADLAEFGPPEQRDDAETMLSFLTPIVKAFLTETRFRKRQSRRADLRRPRLHSRDRHRAIRARQSHHADLRRHHADSGARSARPQSDDDAGQGAAACSSKKCSASSKQCAAPLPDVARCARTNRQRMGDAEYGNGWSRGRAISTSSARICRLPDVQRLCVARVLLGSNGVRRHADNSTKGAKVGADPFLTGKSRPRDST